MSKLDDLKKEQNDYVRRMGGFLELREADDIYNNLNRAQIAAFKEQFGNAFLGSVNFYGEQHKAVVSGTESIYEEYTGQMVYNSGCEFCVPCKDEKLEEMVRKWNSDGLLPIKNIMNRIDELGGLNFIWY